MKKRPFQNRRWVAWLLSMAFVLLTLPSGASWQCLDGHTCPPNCTMQQSGGQSQPSGSLPVPSCCLSRSSPSAAKIHCALCSTARAANSQLQTRCTSPVCVLRIQAKPDSSLQATHAPFVVDTTAILLPVPTYILIPEATASVSFGSSRAPPDRVVARLSAPRAPPAQLL